MDKITKHLLGVAVLIDRRDETVFQASTDLIRAAAHERMAAGESVEQTDAEAAE